MKIVVLEHPRKISRDHFNDIANTPLWSCLMGGYAAAALRAGGEHDVRYHDAAGPGLTFEDVRKQLLEEKPDLLCINAVYLWEHTPALFECLEQLKNDGFSGHINLFGFFPTQVYGEILAGHPSVDSVAVGECEQTLAELAALLKAGHREPTVPGLAVCKNSKPFLPDIRKPAPQPDIFPWPIRSPAFAGTISILGSRGCYIQCSFCPIPAFYNNGPLWRGRTPQNIAAEISALADAGHKDFYFVDPNFIGPGQKGRQRAMTLAKMLAPLSITFGMETRAGDLTAELLAALRQAGLTSLLLGAESGSVSVLNAMHKAQGPHATAQAIQICRQAGIEPEIGFILFLADINLADIHDSLTFLEENQLLDRLDRTINLLSHRQIILKGTTGYKNYLQQGRLTPVDSFGFQGHVPFTDQRVSWLAGVWLPLCRHILASMARASSPIFWKHQSCTAHARMNRYIKTLFKDLLKTAGANGRLPNADAVRQAMVVRIDECLSELNVIAPVPLCSI